VGNALNVGCHENESILTSISIRGECVALIHRWIDVVWMLDPS